ncbi:hypothetical protein [Pseudovibrio sp. WM33]|uniref:hypothetical protein n=1 Tax=Pseudovibrio sp. WM33 TaxID=1735585 RepID=UPI0007AE8258|nr:hypothetical protein [Pseudovibrio sp. WM33]KZL23312.1 hypothetical protein PsWM33_03501 [Pseudovibrio sp. WM33]
MTHATHPIATVIDIPVSGVHGVSFLPVIIIAEQGIFTEALSYVQDYSLGLKGRSLRARADTIARFLNFWNLFVGNEQLSIDEQTNVVLAYVDFRINGTFELSEDHPLADLRWSPVQKEHARNEFKYITEFFSYMESSFNGDGSAKLFDNAKLSFSSTKKKHLETYSQMAQKDFFAHLGKSRRFWAEIREDGFTLPQWVRSATTRAAFRPFPTLDEVTALILSERNVTFKAIWIALAFGSHRISEVLHAWQCDVLPANERAKFFGPTGANDQILFLLAHPSESTYTNGTTTRGVTREQYLRAHYNRLPRTMLADRDNNRIGWKTKTLIGAAKVTDTFWLNPEAAQLFEGCIAELQKFHLHNRTSRKHPYLFVNTGARDENFGEPVKYKRAAKALGDAYLRIGLVPGTNGRNLHGFRHFAKWYAADVLGLPPQQIQVIRGDASIHSQDEYGKNVRQLHEAMTQKTQNTLFQD